MKNEAIKIVLNYSRQQGLKNSSSQKWNSELWTQTALSRLNVLFSKYLEALSNIEKPRWCVWTSLLMTQAKSWALIVTCTSTVPRHWRVGCSRDNKVTTKILTESFSMLRCLGRRWSRLMMLHRWLWPFKETCIIPPSPTPFENSLTSWKILAITTTFYFVRLCVPNCNEFQSLNNITTWQFKMNTDLDLKITAENYNWTRVEQTLHRWCGWKTAYPPPSSKFFKSPKFIHINRTEWAVKDAFFKKWQNIKQKNTDCAWKESYSNKMYHELYELKFRS